MKMTRREALQAGLGAIALTCSSADPGRLRTSRGIRVFYARHSL